MDWILQGFTLLAWMAALFCLTSSLYIILAIIEKIEDRWGDWDDEEEDWG